MFHAPTWRRLVRSTLSTPRGDVHPPLQRGLLLGLPVVATWNAACMSLDSLLAPDVDAQAVRAPVFIVANARSGTTFLHRMMAADVDHFVYFKAWEIAAPAYLQKRLVDGFFALDARLLGARLCEAVKAWEAARLTGSGKVHQLGLTLPEEDEFLFFAPMASQTLRLAFPGMEAVYPFERFDALDDGLRAEVMDHYLRCIRRQLRARGSAARLLSKSPAFAGKMQTLAQTFPDGRFLYLVRHPFETIPSFLKLLDAAWDGMRLPEAHRAALRAHAVDTCVDSLLHAAQVLPTLAPQARRVIAYPDLIERPRETVEGIYDQLGLRVGPAMGALLDVEQARARPWIPAGPEALARYGIDPRAVAARLAPLAERYGWDLARGGRLGGALEH